MTLMLRAQRHREDARKCLSELNFGKAYKLAAAAQKERATEKGRKLLLLTSWLKAEL